ncbi:hypothetical protein THAOC_36502 [Thalassiosira oceanica]|uniref:Uncharacterized protein n=1 Tax=Thalassiosira oceanica TaxID=159749 RepID=K0REE9_THAOC|nr:hypothetical protein THAOC_36502 [Thalassiosira oceanica]|eukprot:EJK44922.1 hypothetical protein THAOC_36502 [Thalassiosira oceanica]
MMPDHDYRHDQVAGFARHFLSKKVGSADFQPHTLHMKHRQDVKAESRSPNSQIQRLRFSLEEELYEEEEEDKCAQPTLRDRISGGAAPRWEVVAAGREQEVRPRMSQEHQRSEKMTGA